MAASDDNGNARMHELTAISDAAAQDEESPLNVASDSLAGDEAANKGESGGESSVSSASFNFINTIVGAGVIGIPYSIYQARAAHMMLLHVAYAHLMLLHVTYARVAVWLLFGCHPFDCLRRCHRLQRSAADRLRGDDMCMMLECAFG